MSETYSKTCPLCREKERILFHPEEYPKEDFEEQLLLDNGWEWKGCDLVCENCADLAMMTIEVTRNKRPIFSWICMGEIGSLSIIAYDLSQPLSKGGLNIGCNVDMVRIVVETEEGKQEVTEFPTWFDTKEFLETMLKITEDMELVF